ncbi:macrolide family glycosyltransferase [Streptoalloteichus hindustanus]
MVSIPAPGHVHPNLEIMRELVARGHRVTYANTEAYAEAIAATGAELVPYTSTLPTEDPGTSFDDQIGFYEIFLNDAIAMLPQLRAAYENDRPDLFLYDIAGAPARVLANEWDVPEMQLSPTLVAWEGYREDMAAMTEAMLQDPRGAALFRRCDEWLTENGLGHLDWASFMSRPPRGLVLIPRALQPNADRVDLDRYTFVGPCFGDRSHQGTWTRPADAEKVVLVSLGSAFTQQPAFYRECLRAFGNLPGWHVVLQIGKHVDVAELGEVPGNVEVHRWVPQLAILEQADLFVTHAGMGGSTEGLYCGVPMIAVPQAVDQFSNADLLVQLGVARRLDTEEATADRLRAALEGLTGDPQVAATLATIRKELREEGGTARAVDLIEARLR